MEGLKIKLKVEEMIQYGYTAVRHFPKSERHVLAAEIRHSMMRILKLVVVCNKRYYKKTTMQDLDTELDVLRSMIRLARELTFLPFRKYEIWARHLAEIGKMIGGWMRWLRENPQGKST